MKNVQIVIDSLDCEELCKYCRYSADCPGGVIGGPNGPIYPPCWDRLYEEDFDLEGYLADLEETDET